MTTISRLVKAAVRLLLSDKDSLKVGARTITRGAARKILDKESDRIEERIKNTLSTI